MVWVSLAGRLGRRKRETHTPHMPKTSPSALSGCRSREKCLPPVWTPEYKSHDPKRTQQQEWGNELRPTSTLGLAELATAATGAGRHSCWYSV